MHAAADAITALVQSPAGWVFAAIWGALWGSFANVAIYRVGLYESVVRPGSRCGRCGAPIAFYDNIPILSWLVLRGHCRRCGAKISARYPLVEALGAAIAVAVWWRFVVAPEGDAVWLLARFFYYHAFLLVLVILAGIDLDHLLLPDRITYPAIPAFFVFGLLVGDVPAAERLVGAVAGYAMVAITAELAWLILQKEGMGYGDAKLLAMIGVALGWCGAVASFFLAPFVGLVIVPPILLFRRRSVFGVQIPYGPFLVVGAAAYALLGERLPWPLTFLAR